MCDFVCKLHWATFSKPKETKLPLLAATPAFVSFGFVGGHVQVCQPQGLPKLTKLRRLCLIMQEVSMQSHHTQLGVIGEKQVVEKKTRQRNPAPKNPMSMQPNKIISPTYLGVVSHYLYV